MHLCFKLPFESQEDDYACWLHAVATVRCIGHVKKMSVDGKKNLLTEEIDRLMGEGFVDNYTIDKGISPADLATVYDKFGFAQISVKELSELMIAVEGEKKFIGDRLKEFFNQYGPLIMLRRASGKYGFHALPILGFAQNQRPKPAEAVLLSEETIEGRPDFLEADDFEGFLMDIEHEPNENGAKILGFWHYKKFFNKTNRLAQYSEENVKKMEDGIKERKMTLYTPESISGGGSEGEDALSKDNAPRI
jgi:hypothetical protein